MNLRLVRTMLVLVFFFVLIGCAGKKTVVVLLPDPDGKVGAVSVTTDGGQQLLSEAGQMTRTSNRKKEPELPSLMEEAKIQELFSEVLAVEPEPPARFILYFDSGSVRLTASSTALLPEIFSAVKIRSSTDVGVTGHTDRMGSPKYNLALSLKRANRVKEHLVSGGVAATVIAVTSHGEANPLVKTADNVAEPRNRRVEVIVR